MCNSMFLLLTKTIKIIFVYRNKAEIKKKIIVFITYKHNLRNIALATNINRFK